MFYILWVLLIVIGGGTVGLLVSAIDVSFWFQFVLCIILGGSVGLIITAIFRALNLI